MTRYARSGNTQKHQKTPGDATPWEEFSKGAKMKTDPKNGNGNQILKGRIEKKKHNLKRKFEQGDSKKFKKFDCQTSKANEAKGLLANEASKSKFSKKKKSNLLENESFENGVKCRIASDESESTGDINQNKTEKISANIEAENNVLAFPGIENNSTTKLLTKRQLKKAKSKMKLIALDVMNSSMTNREVEKNQVEEFFADDKPSTDVIPRDELTSMGQNFESEMDDLGFEGKGARTTKVLTKLQMKKARKRLKLITLETLRSGRYDPKVADNQGSENVTESHNSSPTTSLDKKNKRSHSENTLNVNDVEMDQVDQIQNKFSDNSVEALKNKELSSNSTTEGKTMTKNQWRKARIKRKFELLKAMQASEGKETISDNQTDIKSPTSISEKDSTVKKKMFDEKKKQQKQKIIFPSNVESKISDLKKALVEKGLPAKKIRDLVNKERKHEKLKFKRKYGSKPCFNCRKFGHFLSDCPLPLGNSTQVTGVCFKCGSTEHVSYKCPKKIEGYPLAKCFICKEQGHISKDCPNNDHGVYINGGKCSLCGNVNHLSKDCPSNKKEKDTIVTIDTINEGISVDAETCPLIEPVSIPKNNFRKKKGFKRQF